MNEYRICKYNPIFRVNGIYTRNEWTSVSDVGKMFDDGVLTETECRDTINSYVNCIIEIFRRSRNNIRKLKIDGFERWIEKVPWSEGQEVSEENIERIIRDCLNEKCWCRIESKNFFIHFGYDLYAYVGCDLDSKTVIEIACKNGIFADEKVSPYHCIRE